VSRLAGPVLLCALAAGFVPARHAAAAETAPTAAPARAIGVAEAVAMALEKNENIYVQREQLLSAGEAVNGAKGAYDPFLEAAAGWREATQPLNSAFSITPDGEPAPTTTDANFAASISQLLPTGGAVTLHVSTDRAWSDNTVDLLAPAYGAQTGVEFRQPLLRDLMIDPARVALRVTAADHSRAEASLRREVIETTASVETVYWLWVAAGRAISALEESVRLAEQQLEQTGLRIDAGTAPKAEISQPRAELERRRGDLLEMRQNSLRAEHALKRLILSETDPLWNEPLAPADDPQVTIVPVDADAAVAQALQQRPELAEASAVIDGRRAETEGAKNAVRPALDAVLSYDRFGLTGRANPNTVTFPGVPDELPDGVEGDWRSSLENLLEPDFDDFRGGLVFRIPIGNRSARAAAAIAESNERQADASLAFISKTVRVEVLDAAAALQTAGQRIEAFAAAREAAEVQLSAEQDRYGAGLSTNFLVLTRQNDLSRARLDEIGALTDYRRALTELARATGTLLEQRGIAVAAAPAGDPQ